MESGWWRRKDNGLEGFFKAMMWVMLLQNYFCIADTGIKCVKKHPPAWLFPCGHICTDTTLPSNNCHPNCVEKEK